MEKKKINLSVITEALDEKMEDWQQFYNIRTGEVETIPDFDFIDRSDYEELIDKIENNDKNVSFFDRSWILYIYID